MSVISEIRKPIEEEMKEFEPHFRKALKSNVPLLDIIMNYIVRRKGKQMRPMFVFLTAKMLGNVNESTYRAASLIELLHTATLIHDDVVDESYQRRNFFSINALWRSKVSVLAGDYILSKGLLLAIDNDEFEALKIVSEAVREMAEGELLQLEKSRKLNITEDIYIQIITKKTATLISSCTASGANSASATPEQVKLMREFGLYAGIAFQIKDDLFDYQKNGITGKPAGNDIKEKKMTLPLIYALQQSSESERSRIRNLVRKYNNDKDKVEEVINFVEKNGGLEYATQQMNEYKQKALDILAQFPKNESQQALQKMVEYIVVRKK